MSELFVPRARWVEPSEARLTSEFNFDLIFELIFEVIFEVILEVILEVQN